MNILALIIPSYTKYVGYTGVFIYLIFCVPILALSADGPPPEYEEVIADILNGIESAEVMGYVTDLEDFGTRYGYANNSNAVANWLQTRFTQAGYNSYIEPIPAVEINDIFALDNSDEVWIVGQAGRLFYTNDAGHNWTRLPCGTTDDLNAISFANEYVGFAVGDGGTVITSADGGQTWQQLVFPNPSVDLYGVYFIDEYSGWVCGSDASVYTTDDGGATWTHRNIPGSDNLNDIFFITEYKGWVCGDNGFIAYSGNGGSSWVIQPSGTSENLYAIQALDENLVWAVGNSAEVRRTLDGGQNWFKITVTAQEDLFDLQFINIDVGYIVGADGTFLITDNGGYVWEHTKKLSPFDLNCTSFKGDGVGYLAGGPKCLYSGDGGETFEEQTNFDHSWNIVIGEKAGKWNPGEIVVFCANYDNISEEPYSNAPGADGNGSGVAAILTAADAISEIDTERTIRFICLPSGELGRLGGIIYADNAERDEEEIVAVVNPALIGSNDDFADMPNSYVSYCYSDGLSEDIGQDILDLADIYEIDVDYSLVNDPAVVCSDHAAFRSVGYPALLLTEAAIAPYGDFPNPVYRTTEDTSGYIQQDLLYRNTLLITAAALHLARIYTQGTISEPYPYGAARAYPNPAYPARGDTVTFGDILPPFTVEVFNLSGDRVFYDEVEGGITCTWDLGRKGETVAAGIYLYRVFSPNGIETGKLAVLK